MTNDEVKAALERAEAVKVPWRYETHGSGAMRFVVIRDADGGAPVASDDLGSEGEDYLLLAANKLPDLCRALLAAREALAHMRTCRACGEEDLGACEEGARLRAALETK